MDFPKDFIIKNGVLIINGFFTLLGAVIGVLLGWFLRKPRYKLIFTNRGGVSFDKSLEKHAVAISMKIVNNGDAPAFLRDVFIDGLSYKSFKPPFDIRNSTQRKLIQGGNIVVDSNIPVPQGEKSWNAHLVYSSEPPKKIGLKFYFEGKLCPIRKVVNLEK